jgi:hypothetical protein
MAYVPPHLRNKPQSKQAPRREQAHVPPPKLPVEDSFPALGNTAQPSLWIGRKFAELATEWNEDDEKRKEESENIQSQRLNYTVVLPRFQNIRKFEEPEDRVEVSPSNESPDGWKTIERKKQQKPRESKEKTFEDYDKELEKQEKQDETVWDDVPEHQTCWDERY